MSTLAIQLINEAYKKKSTFLDLGNCGLRDIPEEIIQLKDFLLGLNLGESYFLNGKETECTNKSDKNDFSDCPTFFTSLSELENLTTLHLSHSLKTHKWIDQIKRLSSLCYLDLDGNNLGDTGVKYVSELSSLTTLRLNSNNIGDVGAGYISKLSSLNSLYLSVNNIGEIGATHIGKLSLLTNLELSWNSIGDIGAKKISTLSNLTYLNLRSADIGLIGAKHLSKLSKLNHLSLDFNAIGWNGADYISRLSSLNFLSLYHNDIRDDGAKHLSKLSSLTSLDLASNKIGDDGAKHIGRLLSLTYLNLEHNSIGDNGTEYISKLSSLTYLNIRSNRIGFLGAEYISRLSSLTFLDLAYNDIGETGAKHVSNLSSLTSLNLNYNNIGEIGAKYISKLSLLTYLNLSRNKISSEGARYIGELKLISFLSLGNNKIGTEGIKFISSLPLLTSLFLDKNNLDEYGAKIISNIKSLTSLDIGGNNIGKRGANYISQLQSLTFLYLSNNNIVDEGAKAISRLPSLVFLTVDENNIGDIGAEYLSKLPAIRYLNLEKNKIGDKGAAYLSKIKSLTSLNLANNKIKKFIPSTTNSITTLRLQNNLIETISQDLIENVKLEIDTETADTYESDKIFLHGNPITTPPPEVFKKGRESILEYLEGDLKPLNECKLIFVGDGSVGKTSLMKQLVFSKFFPGEKTTHGINKFAWKGFQNEQGETIKVNLWDFGGQHIQHSLHQFFFTERVVYVLVLNPRNDEKAGYWLDQIDKLGGNSQIIIVYNWKDIEDKQADFLRNYRELRKTYRYLPEPIILSCATGDGIPLFLTAVKTAVLANDGLKTQYPKNWFTIKEKLETRIPIEKHYIKYDQYEAWCAEDNYNDPHRRRNLLRILDSVGSIVFFDKPVLNELQVLNPEWISTGAYAIITSEITQKEKGHLTWNNLCKIFSDEKEIFSDKSIKIKYQEPQFNFILQLMLDYRLCQKNPLVEYEYLIPSAFGEKPSKEYDITGGRHYRLKFQSSFEMLIIHRFIAKNILNIVSNDYWSSGIYFKHPSSNTYALVDTNQYSQVIDCWIKGENIRGMWEVIRNDFREIFNMYQNFPIDEEVEYTASNRTVFLKYEEMITALNNGVNMIPYDTKTGLKNIDVLSVLELFESPDLTKRNMSNEPIKIEVSPTINVNPSFDNSSIINSLPSQQAIQKESPQKPVYDIIIENTKIKKWKQQALTAFTLSFTVTFILVLVWLKKWGLKADTWDKLEKNDIIKWIGIILGVIWNGFIIKSVYDRFLDPSKEKAYRESLRK